MKAKTPRLEVSSSAEGTGLSQAAETSAATSAFKQAASKTSGGIAARTSTIGKVA